MSNVLTFNKNNPKKLAKELYDISIYTGKILRDGDLPDRKYVKRAIAINNYLQKIDPNFKNVVNVDWESFLERTGE